MKIEEILALVPVDKQEAAKKTLEEHGAVNADKVSKFIKTEEGLKLVQPLIDSAVTKGTKTFEKNFMEEKFPGLLDAEIQKRNPEQTPEQKRIAALEAENRKIKEDNARKDQVAKAQKALTDMGVPVSLADKYAGMTDEETRSNVEALKEVVAWKDKHVADKDNEWIAKSGRPGGGNQNETGKTMKREQFDALSPVERENTLKAGINII